MKLVALLLLGKSRTTGSGSSAPPKGQASSFIKWRRAAVPCALLTAGLAIPYEREGNYTIRFEPMAVLQSGVPIPFHIKVEDGRHQPLTAAKVTMQIQTSEHKQIQTFKATDIGAGIYSAKPVFTEAGEWLVMVDVRRDDEVSARTITFEVANPSS